MPMLMTLRMRLPVCPFHSPLRTRPEKSAILSRTAWTWGTTFSPSTRMDAPLGARRATCRTARFSVKLILSPRNMASMCDRRPDSSASSMRSLAVSSRDAIFRIIEEDADGLGRHALAALGVLREELPQMHVANLFVVGLRGLSTRSAWSGVRGLAAGRLASGVLPFHAPLPAVLTAVDQTTAAQSILYRVEFICRSI